MPQIETLRNRSLVDFRPSGGVRSDPASHPFCGALFAALRKHDVRHRPVGGEEENLLNGMNLAIHSADLPRLDAVFAQLRSHGYLAVQTVKLSGGRYRMVFARVFHSDLETAVLEVGVSRETGGSHVENRPGASWGVRLLGAARRLWAGEDIEGNGAFIVFLGPDGVGKTTLLRQVCSALMPIFATQEIYRWRPGRLMPTHHPACLPHAKPLRSFRSSISYLLFTWADFASGYWLNTRRLLRSPSAVIFDRYYHDLLIDPKRYRYNGPMWLARLVAKLVPPHDVFFFVLDADEQAILARKQQLSLQELQRQRAAYRHFAGTHKNSVVIETGQPLQQSREKALGALLQHLAARNQRLISRWLHWPAQPTPELHHGRLATARASAECTPELGPSV